jgi:hypothetical protein
MDADGGVDDVGDRKRRLEHVEMPIGQGIEGACIDGVAVGHGRASSEADGQRQIA